MAWLSQLSPVPSFPSYTGPYQVGTFHVEIPAADLPSPAPAPDPSIGTVSFRIFYPCQKPPGHQKPVRWIPQPQRAVVGAFTRFLGAGQRFSEFFPFLPSLLYYITIPAVRNAPLLPPPTANKRWPIMFFSHGLAGNRNTYSHLCGSLSSHGIVVISMDHRDGSSPIQHVHATKTTEAKIIESLKVSHAPSTEVYEARDGQLRIRLWELGLAHEALLCMDQGTKVNNLDDSCKAGRSGDWESLLSTFKDQLDVHTPGRVSFAGHSFGAATTIQFLKSVCYASSHPSNSRHPLFVPSPDSSIAKQITASTPTILLDLWCLPLRSADQAWMWEKSLPAYGSKTPGGSAVLAVLSQAFVNWSGNLNDTKRAVAPPKNYDGPAANVFYPAQSQHFSQSDFGVLFPYLTKKFLKAEEPERVLRLNMRAALQTMRNAGIEVAPTSNVDMESENDKQSPDGQDPTILSKEENAVRNWIAIETRQLGGKRIDQEKKQSPSDAIEGARAMDI
ncbi:hypothetical protein LTR50_005133 [Elasticomyces elasticus]|nr:hypothetical protein LTR50_005133 [Elasticomyces elasticus]